MPLTVIPATGLANNHTYTFSSANVISNLVITGNLTMGGSITSNGSILSSNVSNSVAITVATTTPTTITSITLTTRGKNVLLVATGDGNPGQGGGWHRAQIYRDSTPIGKWIINENAGGTSCNCPWALTTIDQPAAGTYTYSVRVWQGSGSFTFGEEGNGQAPTIVAVEL